MNSAHFQAPGQVGDLRAAIEYDDEIIGGAAKEVEPELAAAKSGVYQIGQGGRLDFLDALKNSGHQGVPFYPLLK